MSVSEKFRKLSIGTITPVAFYGALGIIFLILLPLSNFPPHLGLTGIMNLVAAYGLAKKRAWAKWLVAALFFVATTISLYTVYYIIFTNWVASVGLLAYAILTWYFTYYILASGKY